MFELFTCLPSIVFAKKKTFRKTKNSNLDVFLLRSLKYAGNWDINNRSRLNCEAYHKSFFQITWLISYEFSHYDDISCGFIYDLYDDSERHVLMPCHNRSNGGRNARCISHKLQEWYFFKQQKRASRPLAQASLA